MILKTRQNKLENMGLRISLLAFWTFFSIMQSTSAYGDYIKYQELNVSGARDFLGFVYFYIVVAVFCIIVISFLIYKDIKVRKSEIYLELIDDALHIPYNWMMKNKVIKIDNIENISFEGFTQNTIRINLKTSEYFIAPRIYNVFDQDIKEIYNLLNSLVVENYKKDN